MHREAGTRRRIGTWAKVAAMSRPIVPPPTTATWIRDASMFSMFYFVLFVSVVSPGAFAGGPSTVP